jgi:hypothetical protein
MGSGIVQGVQGVQEFRSSEVQEFRSSGVQEFRSSAVTGKVSLLSSRIPLTCRIFGVMYSVASGYSELLNCCNY